MGNIYVCTSSESVSVMKREAETQREKKREKEKSDEEIERLFSNVFEKYEVIRN